MNARYSYSYGYTLIELLLYVVIISSLLLGITTFFGLSTSMRVKNQSITEVDQQGLAVMEYITATIRNATSIASPAASVSDTTLSLNVLTASLSPTVFNLSGTTLQVQEGTSAPIMLTNSNVRVTGLSFTNLTQSGSSANGLVQVTFTLSRINASGRNEYAYQKTFTTSAEVQW